MHHATRSISCYSSALQGQCSWRLISACSQRELLLIDLCLHCFLTTQSCTSEQSMQGVWSICCEPYSRSSEGRTFPCGQCQQPPLQVHTIEAAQYILLIYTTTIKFSWRLAPILNTLRDQHWSSTEDLSSSIVCMPHAIISFLYPGPFLKDFSHHVRQHALYKSSLH